MKNEYKKKIIAYTAVIIMIVVTITTATNVFI